MFFPVRISTIGIRMCQEILPRAVKKSKMWGQDSDIKDLFTSRPSENPSAWYVVVNWLQKLLREKKKNPTSTLYASEDSQDTRNWVLLSYIWISRSRSSGTYSTDDFRWTSYLMQHQKQNLLYITNVMHYSILLTCCDGSPLRLGLTIISSNEIVM